MVLIVFVSYSVIMFYQVFIVKIKLEHHGFLIDCLMISSKASSKWNRVVWPFIVNANLFFSSGIDGKYSSHSIPIAFN
jgi:hypothetical protein